MGFAEEEGRFGKGAEFENEVGVWDVGFVAAAAGGEGCPVFGCCCWRRFVGQT